MARTIKGTKGNDLSLNGTNRSEAILGKAGDDVITGFGGNDIIDGGRGTDTAVYRGNIDDYVINFGGFGHHGHGHHGHGHHGCGPFGFGHHHGFGNPGFGFVVDTVGGRDGFDFLKNVEFLQFADATYNVANGAAWRYAVNATVDPIAQDPGQAPGNLYAGTGIPASGFGTARNNDLGIELGLQVIYRHGPTVLSTDNYADGVLEFTVASGPQSTANGSQSNVANRAAWSFQYSVATNTNGDGSDLNDFTFRLLVDVDSSAGTNYMSFQLEPEVLPGAGAGTPQSNFVWRSLDNPSIIVPVDDEGTANVTQNSRNFGFGEYQAILAAVYGPGNAFAGDHEFDIILQALDGDGDLVAQNHIRVNVDDILV